jgi:hypothetical protein
MPMPPPMPIIVGAPRSGTTLLRFMIDAHPQVAIPTETGFLTEASDIAGSGDELRDRFVETITEFPRDAPAWPEFGLPEAHFIHLIRDARDVALSCRGSRARAGRHVSIHRTALCCRYARQQALTMLPPQRSRIQPWKHEMDHAERVRFEVVAAALLRTLGYEVW